MAEKDGNSLSEEAKRAAYHLRLDFEKGGIHLPPAKMDRVNKLNLEIFRLFQEYGDNLTRDPGQVDIFPASRIPKHLQHQLCLIDHNMSNGYSRQYSARNNKEEKGFRLMTEPHILASVLQCVSDEEVRRLAYTVGNSNPLTNMGVLDKLVAIRHELVQLMGYRSFVEFTTKQSLASSASNVMSFLCDMSRIVKENANLEFEMIKEFKRRKCGQSDADLQPWDETYYTGMMKSAFCNFDSNVVASFFSLSNCIKGINIIVKSLFGATFRNVPMAPGESWHPDLLKMALYHPDEGDLGYLYLDLFSRKGKYPGCANFAIKGCRRISNAECQLPVVSLVCNFSKSCNTVAVHLNHWEMETLFHEFGHALHSLLSRTEFQHFSGTRVALDFAETPSNLLEYYAWDYRVLKTFAKHYSTGEVIPQTLVKSIQDARDMFAATELQRQVFYGLADQVLFGEGAAEPRETSSIIADLKTKHTSWKHVDGTHWQIRFTHLLNYGGGYYSYLYARCIASTIWKNICEEDPLSSDVGHALRSKVLQHGGAKDPSDMLRDLAGNDILVSRNGGFVPDTTSLFNEMQLKSLKNFQRSVVDHSLAC